MVYIQSDSDRLLPHHFDAASALYGALDNGQKVRLTSFDEVSSGKFDLLIKQNLFVGSVEFMTEVFTRIGKNIGAMLPSQKYVQCKLKDVLNRLLNGEKIFIKPVIPKLFTGMVFDAMCYSILEKFDEDTDIYVFETFDKKIISEWRCYVHYNNIIDCRNYAGDFKIIPNFEIIDNVLSKNINYPCAYTMDVAILENGENTIIEYNDMWAIGNYGMENKDYYRLLRDRYFEITRN